MDIELLVIPDCPNNDNAQQLLRSALDDIGLPTVGFTVTVLGDDDGTLEQGFGGSPTFLVDGSDLFPGGPPAHTSTCRLYVTPHGLRGLPDLRSLRQALQRAADHASAAAWGPA
ncbi:MAG TPA: hypothetical protein VFP34_09985 [Microlunatus sp.]|nr:hypothetical protein [Microlunatus sp.]